MTGFAARLRGAGLTRLRCERWVRYRISLADLPPPSDVAVPLQPVDGALMERLRVHPECNEPQLVSAFRFWQGGFARGYVWLENDEPLCIQWIIPHMDASHRRSMGVWGGMYPPLPQGIGVSEAIYTFRKGLRRRGGAATPFTIALLHEIKRSGINELRTHIHEDNIPAHRWARRVGWQSCGQIQRYWLNIPGIRERITYIHTDADTEAVGRKEIDHEGHEGL